MLEQGLQSYIFGYLILELKDLIRVAEILRLLDHELINLLHVLDMQKRHPLTVDQLYSYCLALSEGSGGFIDPEILKQYMAYFEFASNFDTATKNQRILAYRYLQQCGIRGDFVDALIQHQDDLWTGQGQIPIPIHPSHQAEALRELVYSRYLPPTIRRALLTKPKEEFSPLEAWVFHYDDAIPSEVDASNAASTKTEPDAVENETLPQYVMKGLRRLRGRFLETEGRCSHGSRDAMDGYLLHLMVAATAQTQLLRAKLNKFPFSRSERQTAFIAGRKQLERRLFAGFKKVMIRQLEIDWAGYVPEEWGNILSLVKDGFCYECGLTDSEGDEMEIDEPPKNQPRIKLMIKDSDAQSRTTVRSRSRSQSTASFHTAQDVAEQFEDSQIPSIASPQRPDYSPINSDEELSDVETTLPDTKISEPLPNFPTELQRRFTPWRPNQEVLPGSIDTVSSHATTTIAASSARSSSLPPRNKAIHDGLTSTAYPPLLAEIEQAALGVDSSIASFSGISRTSDQIRARQSLPLKLKFKPLIQTQQDETSSEPAKRPQTASPQPSRTSSTATVATLNGVANAARPKRVRAPRKDKDQKTGVYTKRETLDSVSTAVTPDDESQGTDMSNKTE